MKQEKIENMKREFMALQDSLDIISGKWKLKIMAVLCQGEFRFSEIEKVIPDITPRMLSKELKILVQNKLVIRKVYDYTPVLVTYTLDDYGMTLQPVIQELVKWGIKHRQTIFNS